MKKKTDTLKEVEIQKLAIPWNKFYDHRNGSYYHSTYHLLETGALRADILIRLIEGVHQSTYLGVGGAGAGPSTVSHLR